jgi:LCP family protein required for cell wall assembly
MRGGSDVTDTAGAPGGPGGADTGGGPGSGVPAGGRGAGRRRSARRRWLRGTGLAVGLAAVVAGGAGWLLYAKLDGNITADDAAAAELARYERERPTALVRGAQNILLIGSDSRSGDGNERYGRDSGTARSDTTILLHLSAGRHSATAVSLPRDLMVRVPGCARRGGGRSEPGLMMFNQAFELGGSACTVRTVERLTGIRVDHYVVVDFRGFEDMVDAVDGVEVCLAGPIRDKAAKLRLPAGRVRLDGRQALGYVRARKSLGDGSDTERMDRQQQFLGALVTKVNSSDVLLNPARLYPVLDAATSSLTTDPGLASLRALYELVRGVRSLPTGRVQFLTVPRESYAHDVNRDQLAEPAARKLFERLRTDAPVAVAPRTARPSAPPAPAASSASSDTSGTSGESARDGRSPAPTFRGNTAGETPCAGGSGPSGE